MNSTDIMQAVIDLSNTRSTKDKASKLARYANDIKGVLKACYNPYWQFNIKVSRGWIETVGVEQFSEDTVKLMNALRQGKLRGNAARAAVTKELNRLEPYSQELLVRILNKDMRFGMGIVTINKVIPGCVPVFGVQLARLYKPDLVRYPCLSSFKIDGLRCIYENGRLYSRAGKEFTGLGHIAHALRSVDVKRIDGELTVQGKKFDDASGDLRSFKQSGMAVFNIFDVQNEEPTPIYKRYDAARLLVESLGQSCLSIVEHRHVTSETEVTDMYNEAMDRGYEGLVLKKIEGCEFNGRNYDWLKLKPFDTVDVLVTDVRTGNGKYAAMVGALECDMDGTTISVGGGLTDDQREAWMREPNLIVGKTIEVEYMEVSKNGALRHPRLKSIRRDK